jgi:1,4-dihydroxy-2-naphthoate octaprenyltransferase
MLNDIVAMSTSSKLRALQPQAFTAAILLLCAGSLLAWRQHASTELNCLSPLARVRLDHPSK